MATTKQDLRAINSKIIRILLCATYHFDTTRGTFLKQSRYCNRLIPPAPATNIDRENGREWNSWPNYFLSRVALAETRVEAPRACTLQKPHSHHRHTVSRAANFAFDWKAALLGEIQLCSLLSCFFLPGQAPRKQRQALLKSHYTASTCVSGPKGTLCEHYFCSCAFSKIKKENGCCAHIRGSSAILKQIYFEEYAHCLIRTSAC